MTIRIDTDQVRRLRVNRGWTQEQLATVSDLSPRTVQRAERKGLCSLETRSALASAFEVSADALDPKVAVQGALPEAPNVPPTRSAVFAYCNGNARLNELVRRIATRRNYEVKPSDSESAYLHEQVAAAAVESIRDLDSFVGSYAELVNRLSDYFHLEDKTISPPWVLSLAISVAVLKREGLEALVRHHQGLRYSGGGASWARLLNQYCDEIEAGMAHT